MTKTELKLATTLANYDTNPNTYAINVSIENGTITMNTIEKDDDGLLESPFIIATFETQDQAIEWANDGRRNWRTLRAAVDALNNCQGYKLWDDVADAAKIHAVAEPTILADDDYINSLDQYRAATAFIAAHPTTPEQHQALADHKQAADEWLTAKSRQIDRILNELHELDLGYVDIRQGIFGQSLYASETGRPILNSEMDEWKASNPYPIFNRTWA